MNTKTLLRVTAAAMLCLGAVGLSGCATAAEPETIGGDIVAPVTLAANDLQGATVDLVVGQALNVTTGSLAVDSFSGEIADPKIAEFHAGRDDGSAQFNPGVTALAAGTTTVIMTNEQGGIQPLEFTVRVGGR